MNRKILIGIVLFLILIIASLFQLNYILDYELPKGDDTYEFILYSSYIDSTSVYPQIKPLVIPYEKTSYNPLLPVLANVLHRTGLDYLFIFKYFGLFLFILTTIFVFLILNELIDNKPLALLGMLSFSFIPKLVETFQQFLPESVSLVLSLTTLLLLLKGSITQRRIYFFGAVIISSIAVCFHHSGIYSFVIVLFSEFLVFKTLRKKFFMISLSILLFLLIILTVFPLFIEEQLKLVRESRIETLDNPLIRVNLFDYFRQIGDYLTFFMYLSFFTLFFNFFKKNNIKMYKHSLILIGYFFLSFLFTDILPIFKVGVISPYRFFAYMAFPMVSFFVINLVEIKNQIRNKVIIVALVLLFITLSISLLPFGMGHDKRVNKDELQTMVNLKDEPLDFLIITPPLLERPTRYYTNHFVYKINPDDKPKIIDSEGCINLSEIEKETNFTKFIVILSEEKIKKANKEMSSEKWYTERALLELDLHCFEKFKDDPLLKFYFVKSI